MRGCNGHEIPGLNVICYPRIHQPRVGICTRHSAMRFERNWHDDTREDESGGAGENRTTRRTCREWPTENTASPTAQFLNFLECDFGATRTLLVSFSSDTWFPVPSGRFSADADSHLPGGCRTPARFQGDVAIFLAGDYSLFGWGEVQTQDQRCEFDQSNVRR